MHSQGFFSPVQDALSPPEKVVILKKKQSKKKMTGGMPSVKQKQSTYHPVAAKEKTGSIVQSVCSISKTAFHGNGRKTKEDQKQ